MNEAALMVKSALQLHPSSSHRASTPGVQNSVQLSAPPTVQSVAFPPAVPLVALPLPQGGGGGSHMPPLALRHAAEQLSPRRSTMLSSSSTHPPGSAHACSQAHASPSTSAPRGASGARMLSSLRSRDRTVKETDWVSSLPVGEPREMEDAKKGRTVHLIQGWGFRI